MPQIAIETHGLVTCPCGHETECDMQQRSVLCMMCKHWIDVSGKGFTGANEILEIFGIKLSLDYDTQLLVDYETEPPKRVMDWLFLNQRHFRSNILNLAARDQCVYVGGSLGGKRHFKGKHAACIGERFHERIGTKHWETYGRKESSDPRLYYLGRSTSQEKARRQEFVK